MRLQWLYCSLLLNHRYTSEMCLADNGHQNCICVLISFHIVAFGLFAYSARTHFRIQCPPIYDWICGNNSKINYFQSWLNSGILLSDEQSKIYNAYHYFMTWPQTMANESYFRFGDDSKMNYAYSRNRGERNVWAENVGPIYFKEDNWENWSNLIHTIDRMYLASISYIQRSLHNDDAILLSKNKWNRYSGRNVHKYLHNMQQYSCFIKPTRDKTKYYKQHISGTFHTTVGLLFTYSSCPIFGRHIYTHVHTHTHT